MQNETTETPSKPGSAAGPPNVSPPPASGGKRRPWFWLVLVILFLVGGIIFWRHHSQPGAGTASAYDRGGFGSPAIMVSTAKAQTGNIGIYVNALGVVTPLNTVSVVSRVQGQIVKVYYQEGQMVHAGDPLVEIDPAPDQAALDQAVAKQNQDQAQLNLEQVELKREAALLAAKIDSQDAYDQVAAQVGELQAAVKSDAAAAESTKVQLAYCHITSPISGRVGLRLVDEGNIVQANSTSTLVVITELQPISVIFNVSEDDLPPILKQLHAGNTLTADAYDRALTKKIATGTLETLDNQIDPTTGTLKFKALFTNDDESLFPNQFVNVRLLVDTLTDVTLLPNNVIQRNADSAFVYVIKPDQTGTNQTVAMQSITIGTTDGNVSSVSGIDPGTLVAADNFNKLTDGAKVTLRPAAGATGATRGAGSKGTGGWHKKSSSASPSRPFILRPVATSLLMFAIVLAGIIAYRQLAVSALPEVDYPTIQIVTFYPGASPDVTASAITAPLERQFGELPGLNQMTSISSGGSSIITLQFTLNLNIDVAEQEVQAAINAAQSLLPTGLPSPPVYSKSNPADTPILTLAVTSKSLPLSQVEDDTDTRLAQKISQVSGVGLVTISGGQKPAVRIQVNPTQLSAYGLGIDQIRTVLQSASVNQAKGNFDGPHQAYEINANDQLLSSKDYQSLVVAYRNGAPVILSDVAKVIDHVENTKLAAWVNTNPAVIVNIQRQPGANIIQVVDNIKKLLPQLRANLPASEDVTIVTDRTTTIRASVHDVQFSLMLTIALVVLAIFLFLRNVRATIIPSVAVPLSLIGTLGIMYLLGFSLNNLTLMALTISTGFVVDDAIVMIENVFRYIELGEKPLQAALKGAEQIGFTIISLTVSLIAGLIPLLFMGDVVGRLFREFAITLSVTILVSAFVSLTLTPMMCARLLRAKGDEKKPGRLFAASEGVYQRVLHFYERTLQRVLDHQPLTLLVAVATLIATILLYIAVPKGFFPVQDTGVIQGISDAAETISFTAMAQRQQALADVILKDPAVESLSSFIGVDGINSTLNSGRILINLKPLAERKISASYVIRRLQPELAKVEGITLYMQPVQDLTVEDRVSRTQYQYTLEDANADELNLWTTRMMDQLQALPQLRDVATDQQTHGAQAMLVIDRVTASRLGITPQAIDNALYDAFGQRQISTLFTQLNQYHVILEALPEFQRNPSKLNDIYVLSSSGGAVPLSEFAHFESGVAPLAINHQGQFPSVTISFNLAPGVSLGQAVKAIERVQNNLHLPLSVQPSFQGTAQSFIASLANEPWLILAAIVTVYIILGVLYESFIHPITILSTLPSAGAGAILALLITGTELGMVALIGIILLIGIVQKNAIMMIDFALDLERKEKRPPREAIYEACRLRFRPILMTTFAAMFGGLPLALGHGVGAELRQPLGIAIVGGLIVSQVLTLYTTPVIYLFFGRLAARFSGAKAAEPGVGVVSVQT